MRFRALPLFAFLPATAVLFASAPAPAAESVRRPVGAVQRLEVTSLLRDRITLWVRAALPAAPHGSRQSFKGRLDLANVDIPFHQPAAVMVQPGGRRDMPAQAVFFVDIDLPQIPEALLGRAGAHALDLTLDGSLTGEKGETLPIFAVGVLRLGTPDVKTPGGVSPDFLRFGDAHLTDVTLAETSGEASLVLFNPFSFFVPIRELSYQLVIGDRVIASGTKRAIRIRPRQESHITLPITAGNVDLAAAAGSAIASGGVLEGRLVGTITLKVASGDVVVPINLPGKVNVGR